MVKEPKKLQESADLASEIYKFTFFAGVKILLSVAALITEE